MTAVHIDNVADFPIAVSAIIGFTPVESLVVAGLSGGPTARVDLGPGAIESLAPAVRHWDRVIVLVYSDDPVSTSYADAFADTYPSVNVLDILTVTGDMVSSRHFGTTEPVASIAPGILGDRLIADSRESVVAEADRVTEPAEALRLAEAYYRAGDGARAWVYVDRARELGGDPSVMEAALMNADDPRGTA